MKNIHKIIVLIIALSLLAVPGCGVKGGSSTEALSDSLPSLRVPSSAEVLSEDGLNDIARWVSSDPVRAGFLRSTYDDVRAVDLYKLFYYGNGEAYEMPLEELRLFLASYGWWADFPVSSITAREMDDALKAYAGISLSESESIHLDGLYYIEAADRYYSLHGDASPSGFTPLFGYRDNGLIYVFYNDSIFINTRMNGTFCATMAETETGYQYIANRFCEDDGKTVSYRTETYDASEDLPVGEEQIETVLLTADRSLSATSPEDAEKKILAQPGFEEQSVTGQNWMDISAYGKVIVGSADEKLEMYYVANTGEVYPLPVFLENAVPSDLLFGGGARFFEYMMEKGSGLPGGTVTDWFCTVLPETLECTVRTVTISLPE